jgi:branched-chain amino acid transport system ATP-binding protein
MSVSALLEVDDMSIAYAHVEAVRNLSFSVWPGQALALLGPNGAGKTSAVEAIAGFLPKVRGVVRFCGRDITHDSAGQIAMQGLALVSQWRDLFPDFSVEETLEAGMHAGHVRGRSKLDDIYSLFPKLAERRSQLAGTLSGGEQQMLAIGRALATEPLMLLLDEPTAGLAAGIVKDLVRTLQTIRQRNTPIVLVEQNIELAAAVADDCIVLTTGAPVWSGRMIDAVRSEEIRQHYFGGKTDGYRCEHVSVE